MLSSGQSLLKRDWKRMINTHGSPKVVVVTGDATMDWNLARTRRTDSGRKVWTADDSTRACWQRRGALSGLFLKSFAFKPR